MVLSARLTHIMKLCSSCPKTCHKSGADRCGADRGRPCAADPGRDGNFTSVFSAITRSAALGGGLLTAAPLAGMGQQDDRGPPGGMATACLPTLALDADTATMAG